MYIAAAPLILGFFWNENKPY